MKKVLCLVLTVLMLTALIPTAVMAANSADADIIKNVEITGVHTPYAGEYPDYSSMLGSMAYTYDDQMEDDPDVYNGKWWYDKTSEKVVSPSDTFKLGHIYTFSILLVPAEGYEFRVDNYNTPFISATVNGENATVYDDLTGKNHALIEYTFEPCDYNYEISEVNVSVTEPIPGEYPDFNIEIDTPGVDKDDNESPYCIYGVAWYDYKTCTYMNPSDMFEEDGIYEANIYLTTLGDCYFSTENNNTDVEAYINENEAYVGTAGKSDRYHIHISYVFGDIREEVEYVDIIDIKAPAVGSNPVFDATPVGDAFYISGVFWTDVTNSTAVAMHEDDTFVAGHTYKLEVWIRANEDYKFCTDEDGYIDIMALVGGMQADVLMPGSEVSAELEVRYTVSASTLISFVDIMYVDAPLEGNTPDMDAFCTTTGCNVTKVEWYDKTEGRGVLLSEDDTFVAGRKYLVVVTVEAEGNYTYELDSDNINVAYGDINGQDAIAYSTYSDKVLELGYEFAPCEENPDKPTNPTETTSPTEETDSTESTSPTEETEPTGTDASTNPTDSTEPSVIGILGDANCDGIVNVKDATAIQKHLASLMILTDTGLVLADVDKSSVVNIKDATSIQKFVAGMDTGLSIGEEI